MALFEIIKTYDLPRVGVALLEVGIKVSDAQVRPSIFLPENSDLGLC